MPRYNWMIEGNSWGRILGIFFSLKRGEVCYKLPLKWGLCFSKPLFVFQWDILIVIFFSPSENQNLNCMVTKSVSEISVYVPRLTSCSSCGVERSRGGIQFRRQAFSCLSHDTALSLSAILSAPVVVWLLIFCSHWGGWALLCSPHSPQSLVCYKLCFFKKVS